MADMYDTEDQFDNTDTLHSNFVQLTQSVLLL